MVKKLLMGFFIAGIFFISASYLFSDENKYGMNVEEILKIIRTEQNVEANSAIDPGKVSNDRLEELGDAVMSIAHPDEQQHEFMDNMMGGEGSENLRNAHIRMGFNYLLNSAGKENSYGRGMMRGPSMRGFTGNYGLGMMNSPFSPFGIPLFIIVLIAIGIAVVVILKLKSKGTGMQPLEVLRIRLAKGEITVEEFNILKQHL